MISKGSQNQLNISSCLAMSFSELQSKEELGQILGPSSVTSCIHTFLKINFGLTRNGIFFRVGMISSYQVVPMFFNFYSVNET